MYSRDFLVKFGKDVEQKFGLKVSIVDAGENAQFGARYILSVTGSKKAMKAVENFNSFRSALDSIAESQGQYFTMQVQPIPSIRSTVDHFKRFDDAVTNASKNRSFWGGEEVYGDLRRRIFDGFEKKWGKEFPSKFKRETAKKIAKKDAEVEEFQTEMRERQKLLSKYEIKQLEKWTPKMVEEYRKSGIKTIVGVDRAGRPLARLIWQTWKKMYPNENPQVFYINPNKLTGSRSQEINFRKKSPYLHDAVKKDSQSVVVLDDRVFSGKSFLNVQKLFDATAGKSKHRLSTYTSILDFQPSWWREKHKQVTGVYTPERASIVSTRIAPSKRKQKDTNAFNKALSNLSARIAERRAVLKKRL